MPRNKRILYALAVAVTAGLLPILIFGGTLCRGIAAAFLTLSAIAVCYLVRKRRSASQNKQTVVLLTVVFVLLYFTLFYLSGLFLGYTKATVPSTAEALLQRALPTVAIVIASETIRRLLLSQEGRALRALAFLIGFLGELALAGGLFGITRFNAFMDMVGFTALPALSSGLLCQYTSAQYGALAALAYRLPITLLPLFVPVVPGIPDALRAFILLLLPLALLLFLRALFEKRQRRATASPHARRLGVLSAVVCLLVATGIIALISCRFRYGAIVIATGSMTGELNVGDVIVYERYEGQAIEEGDIFVFSKNNTLVVHRVVEITHVNSETRYYTKGDANETRDAGYVTAADIIGVTDFKVAYVGYPSLWMQRLFSLES